MKRRLVWVAIAACVVLLAFGLRQTRAHSSLKTVCPTVFPVWASRNST
jgi:hypothetical protein